MTKKLIIKYLIKLKKYKYWKRVLAIMFLLLLLQNVVFLYNNLQNKTPILGLKFEDRGLTGLNNKQIKQIIEEDAMQKNTPLRFKSGEKTAEIMPSEVGYKVNASLLANSLLLAGRTGNIFEKLLTQDLSLLGFENKKIKGTFSQSLLTLVVLNLQEKFDTNPKTISLDFEHDYNKILPPKNGTKIQVDKLNMLILKYISNPPKNAITVPMYEVFANQHDVKELEPIKKSVPSFLNETISITSGGQSFLITPNELKSMLTIVERPDPKNPKKTSLVLRIDDVKLNQSLGIFAAKVETKTHAEFDDHDARIAVYSQFYSKLRRTINIPTGQNLVSKVLGASVKPVPTPQAPKTAYLTFDDGPNTIYHPVVLDILKSYGIQATFFLVGNNITQSNSVARRTFTEGHILGNHSLTHSFMPSLSDSAILNELFKTDNIIKSINDNGAVHLFRPPYGGMNFYVKKDAHALGLRIFLWDVDPRDWSEPSTDELVSRVVNYAHDGSNILLHSNHLATVRALPRIIETLKTEGYIFKSLNDYPNPEEY